ncbi:hypothetical protein LTS07_008504 [Exophiala sideris]|uniref:Transcription factor domain-containing protein n=1 Tax=Exophiala sideris TaxID=1016849 RepID=A0ABR0J332_9EURO|nr:hypothetical protein LTS07_008504 [Exophiala sideris]KAK5030751.1 hypothetical protein LTR13_008105 [Exophiala sideris]KAK5054292.1 hypothetical protein LTR69_008907 [Exophiala sideris]KAK5179694.1 hypothetical protein LTR44_007862 [Eurotiomycetes sp. CCFEE 6388]
MLEVDNREARLLEAVVAASFLATYGQLCVGWDYWRKASTILCNAVTISRRLHLTDNASPVFSSGELSDRDISTRSALVSYMFLIDTMQATHCGLASNFSTSELFIRMPGSNHQFRTIYSSLLHGEKIPQDVRSREDALLLLTALLSDVVFMQRCLPLAASDFGSSHKRRTKSSPFTPLSAGSEFSRLNAVMAAALSRWEHHFSQCQVGNDILALYYFCQLQLICPDTWKLPQMAGYGETMELNDYNNGNVQIPAISSEHSLEVSEKAVALAWLVLDHCHKKPLDSKLSVWLPVIVFLSALLIWQKVRAESATAPRYGILRVLGVFKDEIASYPWPCSGEMIKTLDRLMDS